MDNGMGHDEKCFECRGSGHATKGKSIYLMELVKCRFCDGTGLYVEGCRYCGGHARIIIYNKNLKGVKNLYGVGRSNKDCILNCACGDEAAAIGMWNKS